MNLKKFSAPLLSLLSAFCILPSAFSQTTPVLFSLANLTGSVNNRSILVTPDTIQNPLWFGTNLVNTTPFPLYPVNGQVITNLTPWGYTIRVDGWPRSVHIQVPASTNTLNVISLVNTNQFAPLQLYAIALWAGTNIAFITNLDGSLTINGATNWADLAGTGAAAQAAAIAASDPAGSAAAALIAATNTTLRALAANAATQTMAVTALQNRAITNILAGNLIWLDAVNGNDNTGRRGRIDLPFQSLGTAAAVAQPGDCLFILPGIYEQLNMTLPNGVSIVGLGPASQIGANDGGGPYLMTVGNSNSFVNLKMVDEVLNTPGTSAQAASTNLFFQNVEIDNSQGVDLFGASSFGNGFFGTVIENCHFTSGGDLGLYMFQTAIRNSTLRVISNGQYFNGRLLYGDANKIYDSTLICSNDAACVYSNLPAFGSFLELRNVTINYGGSVGGAAVGILTAGSVSGNYTTNGVLVATGSGLTSIPAGQLTGTAPLAVLPGAAVTNSGPVFLINNTTQGMTITNINSVTGVGYGTYYTFLTNGIIVVGNTSGIATMTEQTATFPNFTGNQVIFSGAGTLGVVNGVVTMLKGGQINLATNTAAWNSIDSTTMTITNSPSGGKATWSLVLRLTDAATGNPAFQYQIPGDGTYKGSTNIISPNPILSANVTTNEWDFPVGVGTTNTIVDLSGSGASVQVISSHITF